MAVTCPLADVEGCADHEPGQHDKLEACGDCVAAGGCDSLLATGAACQSCDSKVEASNSAEKAMIDRVDELDERITKLRQRGRARKYAEIIRVYDGRK
jgi:hypothetical protein